MSNFDQLVEAISPAVGWSNIISSRIRRDETPPSAAWHLMLAGSEYILTLTPTDLESLDEIADTYERQQREGGDEASEKARP